MKPIVLALAMAVIFNISYAQNSTQYSRAKVFLDQKSHTINDLATLGIAVDHGEHKKNAFFISDLSAQEIEQAKAAGFKVDIIIKDVTRHYQDQNKKKARNENHRTTSVSCGSSRAADVPSHFRLGTYGGYFTYDEMIEIIDSMRLLYPSLISAKLPIDTFHSIQGRPLYWIRISNNPTVDQPAKPQMLVTSLHHAREPGSLSTVIFYLWYLLEHYSTDPQIKAIIDNTELYFVPCVNPDGYIANINASPSGGSMIRKNLRDNLDGTTGVDLNRNYGYLWGYDNIGSSNITSSDTYRGTAGFSEPETQAVKWFTEQHQFRLCLNYHTYHNDMLYPWSHIPSFQTADSQVFFDFSSYITEENRYRFGTCNQVLNYITNGSSDDWMYGDVSVKPKIFSFTPEVGANAYGFYPPDYMVTPDAQNNLWANINTASLLLPFATINNTDKKILISQSGYLHYSLQRLGFPNTATFTLTVHPLDAWLTVPATPKTYTGLAQLQEVNDSISYTLAAGTPNGQLVSYVLQLNNGYYNTYDTVRFYYGKEYSITTPSANSLTDWINNGWGVSTGVYHSAPASIQSSVTGADMYPDNADLTISTAQPADLTYATQAYLHFFAKWAIEAEYDSVIVSASVNGSGFWTPLCGRKTRVRYEGSIPLFDGQQPDWIMEEMDLHDYLGQKINIQFQLGSDNFGTYQGFYFDDVSINTVQDTPVAVRSALAKHASIQVYPNPAHNDLAIALPGCSSANPYTIALYDCVGREVMAFLQDSPKKNISVQQLPAGIYYLRAHGNGQALPVQKVNILK